MYCASFTSYSRQCAPIVKTQRRNVQLPIRGFAERCVVTYGGSTIDTYDRPLNVFELFCWLQECFRPAQPSDPDTMTISLRRTLRQLDCWLRS